MDEQRQDDQLEPAYNSSISIEDVALKSYRKRWTIENGSGKGSRDDDDDDVKARIDKMQQNSKCRLCGDLNETINHVRAN